MVKPAVFLDRDGVLNIEAGHIHDLADLNLIPGVAAAVRSLNDQGIFCCLVTNQAGPALDYYGTDHVEALNERLCTLLKEEAGAHLDALYYCPYLSQTAGGTHPDFTQWGTWRKPNTGMLVTAAWEYDLDLRRSFMVSDKTVDIALAHNAGLRGILIQTASDKPSFKAPHQHHTKPDYVAATLQEGVTWVLQQLQATL
ncbi:HAD family hydrolase [Synechococcus moorigangaii CMS01]|nr:HAD family hydrolase [Synechococcus moorigangaii CMS01]